MKWFFILIVIVGIAGNFVHSDSIDLSVSNNDPITGNTKVISKYGSTTTIIGDEQSSVFLPTLKYSKQYFEDANITISWNNANILTASSASVNIEDKVVKYKKNVFELWFYNIPSSTEYKEGAFEFMVKVNSRPATNCFTYTMNAPNINFFYQPALDKDPTVPKGFTCNATSCTNGLGTFIERPLNIVESYAIYHYSKINNEYQSGKIAHFYRPFINDSNGNFNWGTINITNILNDDYQVSLCFDKKALDIASYPNVYIDPTIGIGTVGASSDNTGADYITTNLAYAPESGNITQICGYASASAEDKKMVIYNVTESMMTGPLMYNTSVFTIASTEWNCFNVPNITVHANNRLAMGWFQDTGAGYIQFDSAGGVHCMLDAPTTFPDAPSTLGCASPGSRYYSVYANYTRTYINNAFGSQILGTAASLGSGPTSKVMIGKNAMYQAKCGDVVTLMTMATRKGATDKDVWASGILYETNSSGFPTTKYNATQYANFNFTSSSLTWSNSQALYWALETGKNYTIAIGNYTNASATYIGGTIPSQFEWSSLRKSTDTLNDPWGTTGNTAVGSIYSIYATFINVGCGGGGDNFTPSFDVRIGFPLNGTSFTYGYNFTAFYNITGNGSSYDAKYNLDGQANITIGNILNYTNTTQWIGVLSAGQHNITICGTNSSITNCSTTFFQVNKTSNPLFLHLNKAYQNLTITYPNQTNATGWDNIGEGSITLYRNGTNYGNPEIATLGVGVWNYTLDFPTTQNYTANSTILFLTVQQNSTYSLSISIQPSSTITYGTQTTVSGSGCPNGLTCTLFRNAIAVSNPYVSTEGAGTINFEYNTTGSVNYSSKTVSSALTVNQYPQFCNATIDGVWQNKTITYGTSATMNGSSSNVTGLLYRNGTSIAYPNTGVYGVGVWNFTFSSLGNTNYTSCTQTVFLTVNKATPSLSITLSPSDTVTYPKQTTATGLGCTAPLTCTLYRDVTIVSNPDINSYNVGSYNYIFNTTGNENYSSTSASNLLTVNQNTTWWLNITVSPSSTVTYGTQTTLTGIQCPAELTCTLYRNGTSFSNPNTATLGVGYYNYTYYSAGNGNYGPSTSNQTIVVNQFTQWCNLTINGTEGNKTYLFGTSTNATGNSSNLTNGTLYRNGSIVSNPELATLTVGVWNYTFVDNGNQNYSSCYKTYFVQINQTSNDTFVQTININHPINGSIFTYPYNLTAYFNITGNATSYTSIYRLDNNTNNSLGIIQNNTNTTIGLGILLGGWHNVTVCATNSTENCSTNHFFINQTIIPDTTPPSINITSPLNATYTQCSNNILLNATANETVISWWFSLNGGVNTSFSPTVYITAINGSNNITVWANDSSGNIGYSTIFFNLALTTCPTPTPSNATNIIVVLDAKPTGDNNIMYLGIMGLLFLGIGGYFFMQRKGGQDQAQETVSLTQDD